MSQEREIRCYDYVNHPYQAVRDALREDALGVFQKATKGAASRAESIAAELRVEIGGVGVAKDIEISVTSIEEVEGSTSNSPVTRLSFQWEAADNPGLFPLMSAELALYPLTDSETQLDFSGVYSPPIGALGGAIDSLVGRRVAEVSVHRFVADVATYLRESLTSAASN